MHKAPISGNAGSISFPSAQSPEAIANRAHCCGKRLRNQVLATLALVATLLGAPAAFGQATRIEAEDFSASSGVVTESTSDVGGGENLGDINHGDWAEYAINVPQAGTYEVDFRVVSNGEGGTIALVSGGSTLGSVNVEVNGDWQDFTTVSTTVNFANSGPQTVRLNFTGNRGFLYNLNWFSFQVPSLFLEAENFTAQSGVRTETTADTGGGLNLGYIENGDWTQYSVTIPSPGDYVIEFRTASNNNDGGEIEIVADGATIGNVTVPDTNGWQNWTTISSDVTFATAGTKNLRLNFTGGAASLFNMNWLSISPFVPVEPLAITVGNTLQQKMRYGMDYERLWYWSGNLNGAERNEVARWSVVDADVDFVRVAMNSRYELTEGNYDLSAYTGKIIPLMQEMQEANPDIKFFASPRPLNEAYSSSLQARDENGELLFRESTVPGGDPEPVLEFEGLSKNDIRWQPYPLWVTDISPTETDPRSYTSSSFDFGDIKCAEYIVRYLLLMKSYGFKISFLDVTNEWQSNGGGGRLTQDDMDDIHNYLHVTYMADPWPHPALSPTLLLEPEDIPELIAPSSWNYQQGTSWIANLDNGDNAALSIAASHNTDRGGSAQAFAQAARDRMGDDVEVWNTELHGWKSTSNENETTSFYYYLEAIRAGFGGINGWLAIGTTNQGHSYILNPGGTPRRNVKYYIYRKLASTSNYGHALNILEEPEEGVLNDPLDSNDDDVPRNVAAFLKGNLMTVWVVNENSEPIPFEITPDGRTIAEATVRRTHWADPSDVEGFVTYEEVESGTSFVSTLPGASVSCFEIVLDGEDFSNDLIQAEDFTHQWDTDNEVHSSYTNVASISDGSFTRYGAVALEEDAAMSFSVARPTGRPDGIIEVREGSADGPILGQVAVPVTRNWQNYRTVTTTLDVDAGIYNLYLTYAEDAASPTGNALFNIDWFTVNDSTLPPAPTGVTATAAGSQINLFWNTVTEATSYQVWRATSEGGTYSQIGGASTFTSMRDTNALSGTTYYYVVRAVNDSGESADSAFATASLSLAEPTNLTASNISAAQIDLSWTAASGATGYTIERSLTSGGPYTDIATGVTSTNYSDTAGLNPGTRYYYVVTATSPTSTSGLSAESSAVPSDPVVPEDVAIAEMDFGHDLAGNGQISASIIKSGLGQFYRVMATPDLSDPESWTPASDIHLGNGDLLEIEFDFDHSADDKHFFRLEAWTE